VGVGIFFYSKSNNSNPGPSSSNSDLEVIRDSVQSVISAAKDEFSCISDLTKRRIQELSDVSQNLTFDAVDEAKNTSYINNIVNIDDVKIGDIVSERIIGSLVPEIDKVLVSFQESTMGALGEFGKDLTEKTADAVLQSESNVRKILSECEGTNSRVGELANSFKSINFNLRNAGRNNDEATANIMAIRSGIQELGTKNPTLVGDIQGLGELCTYVLNLLN
jgi:methyl-accepting chemotaxis protein